MASHLLYAGALSVPVMLASRAASVIQYVSTRSSSETQRKTLAEGGSGPHIPGLILTKCAYDRFFKIRVV